MRMKRRCDSGLETHFAKRAMSCLGQRFIYWVENSPLANDSSEDVSEDRPFTKVTIVSKRQTLFKTTFSIGSDQMCQARDDKFTKF